MKALEFTAEVDRDRRLQITLPAATAPGPVRVLVLLPETTQAEEPTAEEAVEKAWMRGVAQEWGAEMADTREDIYTLEDGEPVHAAR